MTKRICAIVVKSSVAVPGEISTKLETAIRMGCTGFISGLEYGAGLTAAEAILQRKADRPCLTLECVIPYEECTSAWDEPSRDRYFDIVSRCDKETMLMHQYAPDCMARKREYLLRNSDNTIEI